MGSSNSRYLNLLLRNINIVILIIKSDIIVLVLIIIIITNIDLFFN